MSDVRPTRWFHDEPGSTRIHVGLRWLTGPFGAIEALIPRGARVLDWACGHGLLGLHLAGRDPTCTVRGTDIDDVKLSAARRAARAAGVADRLTFEHIAPDAEPGGEERWDAVVLDDLLYLLAPDRQRPVVEAAARLLAPGGLVICKEMGATPRWKATLSRAQEQLAVRALRVTATDAGAGPFPVPETVAGWLDAAGLATEVRRIDRGYHTPHVLVIGRRREGPADGRLHA